MYSVRLNLGLLLAGQPKVKSQYPLDSMFGQVDMEAMELPRGRPVLVTVEDYNKTGIRV